MKKISNREEANKYYKLVNKGVDDFSEKTKSKPSEIHKYLSRNNKRFLKQLELDEVDGIENVLKDVLSHKKHLEDDKIITFESFTSLGHSFINVGLPSIEHEKILADKFNTSLGHIDLIDSELHLFRINDFGKEIFAVIYGSDEFLKIKEEFCKRIYNDVINKMVSVAEVGNVTIDPLKFWLSDFIDTSSLKDLVNTKVNEKMVMSFILSSFPSIPVLNFSSSKSISYSFYSGFHIWFF